MCIYRSFHEPAGGAVVGEGSTEAGQNVGAILDSALKAVDTAGGGRASCRAVQGLRRRTQGVREFFFFPITREPRVE